MKTKKYSCILEFLLHSIVSNDVKNRFRLELHKRFSFRFSSNLFKYTVLYCKIVMHSLGYMIRCCDGVCHHHHATVIRRHDRSPQTQIEKKEERTVNWCIRNYSVRKGSSLKSFVCLMTFWYATHNIHTQSIDVHSMSERFEKNLYSNNKIILFSRIDCSSFSTHGNDFMCRHTKQNHASETSYSNINQKYGIFA